MQTNTTSIDPHHSLSNEINPGVLKNRRIDHHNGHNQVGASWFKSKSSGNSDNNQAHNKFSKRCPGFEFKSNIKARQLGWIKIENIPGSYDLQWTIMVTSR